MRSIYTPQQETNSAYNPGVTYQGGQFLAQGIGQAGNAIAEGLQRYAANKEEAAALDTRFESTAKPLMEKLSLYGQLADENSPATALLDKAGDWHKLGNSQKKVLLADMLLLGDKAEADQRRKQDEQWKLLTAQHQATQEDLQKNLQDVMLPYHREQTANLVNAREQEQALGNALATFGRGGTVVDAAPNALAQWADRAMTYNGGQVPPPELSRDLSYSERLNRALQTPGLGGTGAVRLAKELERFQPKEVSELDRATIALRNAQAMKAMQELNGPGESAKPPLVTPLDVPGVSVVQDALGRHGLHIVTDPTKQGAIREEDVVDAEGNPTGRKVTRDAKGKITFTKPMMKPGDGPTLSKDGKFYFDDHLGAWKPIHVSPFDQLNALTPGGAPGSVPAPAVSPNDPLGIFKKK